MEESKCIYCGNEDPFQFEWLSPKDDINGEYVLWCTACDAVVAGYCDTCGGEGWVYADEYSCDWINYTHELIDCPECLGDRVIWKTRGEAGLTNDS